jgi:integrase
MTTAGQKQSGVKNLVARDGIWYVRAMLDGKRVMQTTGYPVRGRAEKALAEAKAREILTERRKDRDGFTKKPKPAATTTGAWCDKYVRAHQSAVANTTFLNLQRVSQLLQETVVDGQTWAERDIAGITETDCRALQTVLRFSLHKSQNTRRTFHSIAQSIFERAVKEKLMEANPWDFEKPKIVPRERVVAVAEEQAVRTHLQAYYDRVLTLEVFAGLRVACELAELKTGDIQFERRQVEVREGKGGKKRFVPLFAEAAQALREQLALNAMGKPGTDVLTPRVRRRLDAGYVFPASPRMALRAWHLAADAAGIERFTSHDLRRTFGTRCAEQGVHMKTLQRWMGHSDISITAKFYVHLGNDGDAALMDRMSASLKEEVTKGLATEVVTPLRMVE